jgi:hypothetical protein
MQYSTDEDYRKTLRNLFSMDETKYPLECEDKTIDIVSRDELSYDEEAAKVFMDKTFQATKDHPLFEQLYEKAAGFMFSTDPEIGMTILFGYDYLDVFGPCVLRILKEPTSFNATDTNYQLLVTRLFHG